MNFRRATIDDIEILVELRKRQLVDEGIVPNVDIDDELISFLEKEWKMIR